jgi:hypothetical protein
MVNPRQNALARDRVPPTPGRTPASAIEGLPQLEELTLLDRYLVRLCERIKADGLKSLHWVTGIHTSEIKSILLQALVKDAILQPPRDESHCIVVRPGEGQLVEPFRDRFRFSLWRMKEFYAESFIIVNKAAVLDVSPVVNDDGSPEFIEDASVVDTYIGLFMMLKNRSTPA